MSEANQPADQFDFGAILLGEFASGKSTIFEKIKQESQTDPRPQTSDVDVIRMTRKFGEDTVNINLWDTGGVERFRSITESYYRNITGIILVFSVDDQQTCTQLTTWVGDALKYIKKPFADITWVVWGNKCDLQKQKVGIEEAKCQLDDMDPNVNTSKVEYFEVSGKSGKNVESALERFIELMYTNAKLSSANESTQGTSVVPGRDPPEPTGGGCKC